MRITVKDAKHLPPEVNDDGGEHEEAKDKAHIGDTLDRHRLR
jgi:hypothetical protein